MTDHSIRETVKTRLENEHLSSAPFDADKLTDAIHTAYLSAGWRQGEELMQAVMDTLPKATDGFLVTVSRREVSRAFEHVLSASPQPEVKP